MFTKNVVSLLHPILHVPSVQLIVALPHAQALVAISIHTHRSFLTFAGALLKFLAGKKVNVVQIFLKILNGLSALFDTG